MFKSILTVAAVLSVAAPAMASKARLASLQNAAHLVDTQSIFDNPAKSYLMGDFATLEFGATSTASNGANTPENFTTNGGSAGAAVFYGENAEGGFVKSYGDAKVGFYMGRKSPFTTRVRSLLGFAGQENPIEFMYGFQAGDMKMAASFNYSKSDKKVAGGQQKQDAMGLRFGAVATNWDAALTFGLGSKATGNAASGFGLTAADADSEYKGTTGFKLNGGYWFENTYVFASYYQDGVELSGMTGAGGFAGVTDAKIEQSQYEIGVIDTIKADGMNFFYGVSYLGFTSDDKEDNAAVDAQFKAEQTMLPFVVGVEADAASWLVLRASVKQNVILGSNKTNGGDSLTNANNTTVALGAGMKFNKFMLDSTLAAGSVPATAGTGNINANDLMANASLTYLF
ncbi:hypothetical protein [Bdellovibrio sp. HCB337]|uniref:hypothetical protein n=1 Tax=Bdellovibrio sp. HCB337 TaxID=3394358 RepID=UPI0039A48111